MIKTKKDLEFYIASDRIMNGYPARQNLKEKLMDIMRPGGGNYPLSSSLTQI